MIFVIKIILALLPLSFCFPMSLLAQLRYPIVGTYNKKSAQGMAIWGNKAYLFNNGGHCRILNLITEQIEGEYDLASAGQDNHVNNASFGCEIIGDDDKPVLYISETNGESRCFVERMGDSCSVKVQTIQIQNDKGKRLFVQSWIVDRLTKSLYTVTRMPAPKGEKGSKLIKIEKYRLPTLAEGDSIILTKRDCQESFFVEFASGTQGGFIRGKYMFIASGLQESARGRYNAERALQVIDLEKKKMVNRIDLSHITTNEPEGLDYYNGKILLFCGQEGGIYNIDIK